MIGLAVVRVEFSGSLTESIAEDWGCCAGIAMLMV